MASEEPSSSHAWSTSGVIESSSTMPPTGLAAMGARRPACATRGALERQHDRLRQSRDLRWPARRWPHADCLRGSLPRARQRGSCFERRIQRPAEKSNLLPGHHRSGALPESCKRRSGGLRWRWVLLRKEPHQLRPVRGNSRARLPTHAGRKRSEKWPHSRVSGAEVLKYPAEARRNGNGMTVYSLQLAHLGLMDCINWRNPPWLNLNSALLRMPRQAESMHKGPGQSHLDPRMGTQGHGLSRLWRNPMF